jgi:glyoxylase-like metal-dependent hydrolase (beta-lactamase superfamily II)
MSISGISRRRFLADALSGLGGLSALSAARGARAQAAAAGQPRIDILRGDLVQISLDGNNVLALPGPDSLALVDTGPVGATARLEALLQERFGGVPVSLVFNTHWHEAHTGGNDVFGADGARILAHENTRLWMSTEYYVDWEQRNYEPRAPVALPNETFFSSDPQPLSVEHGGESVTYAHLREAHTDGDIYVHFEEHNVLAVGGVSAAGEYPVPDYATGGWIGGLTDATARLIEFADADTLIVPARGPVRGLDHLRRQHAMLLAVRERMESLMRDGRSVEEMLAAGVTDDFDAEWGANRERFVANVYGGLWWVGRLTNSL